MTMSIQAVRTGSPAKDWAEGWVKDWVKERFGADETSAKLCDILIQSNRIDDLVRAATGTSFLQQMLNTSGLGQ